MKETDHVLHRKGPRRHSSTGSPPLASFSTYGELLVGLSTRHRRIGSELEAMARSTNEEREPRLLHALQALAKNQRERAMTLDRLLEDDGSGFDDREIAPRAVQSAPALLDRVTPEADERCEPREADPEQISELLEEARALTRGLIALAEKETHPPSQETLARLGGAQIGYDRRGAKVATQLELPTTNRTLAEHEQ